MHPNGNTPMARRARLRMLCLAPLNLPSPGTVAAADLRTSMCDARIALCLALGERCDLDGFIIREEPAELVLFEVAA